MSAEQTTAMPQTVNDEENDQTGHSTDQTENQKCPFLRLRPELRNEISAEVCEAHVELTLQRRTNLNHRDHVTVHFKDITDPPYFLTCCQLQQAGVDMYYSQYVVVHEYELLKPHPKSINRHVRTLSAAEIERIRREDDDYEVVIYQYMDRLTTRQLYQLEYYSSYRYRTDNRKVSQAELPVKIYKVYMAGWTEGPGFADAMRAAV